MENKVNKQTLSDNEAFVLIKQEIEKRKTNEEISAGLNSANYKQASGKHWTGNDISRVALKFGLRRKSHYTKKTASTVEPKTVIKPVSQIFSEDEKLVKAYAEIINSNMSSETKAKVIRQMREA